MVMKRETDQSIIWSLAIEWNMRHCVAVFSVTSMEREPCVDKLLTPGWKQFDSTQRYEERSR
jgi:hypothetical protein